MGFIPLSLQGRAFKHVHNPFSGVPLGPNYWIQPLATLSQYDLRNLIFLKEDPDRAPFLKRALERVPRRVTKHNPS